MNERETNRRTDSGEPTLIRLALVITELEVGGAERCLTNLALRLDKHRFAPVVYSLAPCPAGNQCALVDQLETAGIPVEFLDARGWWQARSVLRKLQVRLSAQRPDLVQTFLFHANVLGALAARRAGIGHVVAGVRVAEPARWRRLIERRCTRYVERLVCVSESVATWLRRQRVPDEKLCVIPNGIDLTQYPVRPVNTRESCLALECLAPGRRALVVVGRLHRQKGMDWLLQIAPRLFQSIPEVDLLIVGRGPDQSQLMSLARRLGIGSHVHFLGWRDDVPAILASGAMLILPSRWEGMPNAVLEAMAAGLPVIATRTEGVAELLGNDSAPQIVDFGDSAALITSIASILNDSQLACRLGAGNRQRVAEHFTLDRMVQRYQELYLGLLRARTAGEC